MKYYTQKEIDELTAGYEKWFEQFIYGQTCPLIEGKCAYWKHDVDRFLKANGLSVGDGNEM